MAASDIRHWIVLMMENRSFDHLFGYLPLAHCDNLLSGGKHACDGVGGGDAWVFQSTGAPSDYVTAPDPGHGFDDVNFQIYGPHAAPPAPATMRGFVQSFARQGAPRPLDVMRCFRPQDVPVLTALAESFVLCDRWFCSLPSSTWPNRYFFHAATSMGWPDLSNTQCRQLMDTTMRFSAPTLFGRIAAAQRDWRVYQHNPPHAATLAEIAQTLDPELDQTHWRDFDPGDGLPGFAEDVAAGELPFYTFIEPQFDPTDPNNAAIPDNSGHPSGNFQRAMELIRAVYNPLRQSALWRDAALLIVWDEHGGFYDHVVPPSVPAELTYAPRGDFRFDRLGPRVPALVISPRVQQGVVDHGPGTTEQPLDGVFYDHTSFAATILGLIGGRPLTGRDAQAKTLTHLFDHPPRTDCLPQL